MIPYAIALAIVILLAVIIIKFIKKILLIIVFLFLLFAIFLGYNGYLVYKDILDIQQHLETSQNAFLLSKDGKFIAGFSAVFSDAEKLILFSENDIKEANSDYKKLAENNYKVFIFSNKILADLPDTISFSDFSFEKQQFIDLFESTDPVSDAIAYLVSAKQIPDMEEAKNRIRNELTKDAQDKTAFKGLLFALAVQHIFKDDKSYIFEAIKEKKLTVYPETPAFKAIKFVPNALLNKFVEKLG